MVEVTAQNFEQEVKSETDKLVLVDFWSEKCEKCMALMPEVEELEKKYADKVKFAKVDAAKDRRFCWSLKVMSLPTFQLYKNGEKVDEITQDVTVDKIEEMINKYFLIGDTSKTEIESRVLTLMELSKAMSLQNGVRA